MTYTDKELDNILDISHLKIKVSHFNGTEAFISKIGNLKLSNGLTLYDVLVIPEYCVTMISVHKLAKENKVVVSFDENKCYFLNHDLSLRSVLGTGNQCEGLYYYNNQGLSKSQVDQGTFCFKCHVSSSLGELVHLDLWGPYKVATSEGFRSDNGTGFVNQSVNKFCVDKGFPLPC
ncbi:hypothetical protein Tco_0123486 [Tanacetum coccineum]